MHLDAIAASASATAIAIGSDHPAGHSGQPSLIGALKASVSVSGCPNSPSSSRADVTMMRIAANNGAAMASTTLADIPLRLRAGPRAGVALLLPSQAVTAPAPAPVAQTR